MADLSAAEYFLHGLQATAAVIYLLVGILVLRRDVSPEARAPLGGFGAFWIGLGVISLASVVTSLSGGIEEAGLTAWRLFIYTFIPMIFVAVAGLLYYLLYLYTGHHGIYRPIVAFFIAMTAYMVWLVEGFGPFMTTDEAGDTVVEFMTQHPTWATAVFSLGLVGPVLVAALLYGALFFRLDDRQSRYRVGLVSVGLILWFGFSLLNTLASLGSGAEEASLTTRIASQLLGLLAALMVLAAFVPPAPIQRWIRADSGAVG